MPHGGDERLDRIGGAQMPPMLRREAIKRKQHVLVFGEAGDCLGVFGAVGFYERVVGTLGIFEGGRHVPLSTRTLG